MSYQIVSENQSAKFPQRGPDVREHHAYQDGSGYPEGQGGALLSAPGQLLGIVDYFDELITVGGASGALPAALAIRRSYLGDSTDEHEEARQSGVL